MEYDIKQIMKYLKEHGKEIGYKAKEGEKKAKKIIELYFLVHKRIEPCAVGLLSEAIVEYQKRTK